ECAGVRNEMTATGLAGALFEPLEGRAALAIAEIGIVDRNPAIEVRRAGAGESRAGGAERTFGKVAGGFKNGLGVAVAQVGRHVAFVVGRVGAHDQHGVGRLPVPDVLLGLGEAETAGVDGVLGRLAPAAGVVVVLINVVGA